MKQSQVTLWKALACAGQGVSFFLPQLQALARCEIVRVAIHDKELPLPLACLGVMGKKMNVSPAW